MNKDDFGWLFLFGRAKDPHSMIELSDDDPRLNEIKSKLDLLSAKIAKRTRRPGHPVLHSINLGPCTLGKVFWRKEVSILSGRSRSIPCFEILKDENSSYVFAFPDRLIVTDNRRFYRKEWDHGE